MNKIKNGLKLCLFAFLAHNAIATEFNYTTEKDSLKQSVRKIIPIIGLAKEVMGFEGEAVTMFKNSFDTINRKYTRHGLELMYAVVSCDRDSVQKCLDTFGNSMLPSEVSKAFNDAVEYHNLVIMECIWCHEYGYKPTSEQLLKLTRNKPVGDMWDVVLFIFELSKEFSYAEFDDSSAGYALLINEVVKTDRLDILKRLLKVRGSDRKELEYIKSEATNASQPEIADFIDGLLFSCSANFIDGLLFSHELKNPL